MSIIAIVENGMIKLPPDLHVPDGTRAEVTLQTGELGLASGSAEEVTDALLAISARVKELPADLAAQHDHYLHGQPKL